MKTLPAKNYTPFSGLDHLCLPIDVGVLIPQNDSVRLLVFVLKQLNVKPLYEAYAAYGEKRRREETAREREAAERGAGTLPGVDEAEAPAPQPGRKREKKKDGRPPYDILVLLAVVIYGYMEGIYSSRDLASACRRNINFMWLLPGNPPPSHGMINAFRKHLLGAAIETLFYEVVRFLGDCGEISFTQVFIDGTIVEAQAKGYTEVWRKNLSVSGRVYGVKKEPADGGFKEGGKPSRPNRRRTSKVKRGHCCG